MKNLTLFIPFLLFSFNSHAFDDVEVEVAVDSQHEECFYVNEEKELTYQYSSNSPLDFNLHYHDDSGMNFIIELTHSSENKKIVKPLNNKQVYCLMWVNSVDKPATLTYKFTME